MRSRKSPDSGAGMTSPPTHQNRPPRISIPDSAQHKSALEPLFGSAVAKGLVSRTLALTGIEPVPAECNGSPLHRDAGRLRLSLDPSSRGISLPLATRDQDFRVLDHDRCFGTGVDRREMSALPSGHPSTRGAISPLDLKGGAAADDEEG